MNATTAPFGLTPSTAQNFLPEHLVRQADDFKTRYVFLPVFGFSSAHQRADNGMLPAGCIVKIAPPVRHYRPDELQAAGIQREHIQRAVKTGEHGERELWLYAEPAKPILQLILAGTANEGGAEIPALVGHDLSPDLLARLNRWLFSRGTETAAQMRASLERAGEPEFFAAQGLPTEARDIFREVLAACRAAFETAELAARREYEAAVRRYEGSRVPNSDVVFHDDARYRKVLAWLEEVPVTDFAQRQATGAFGAVLGEVADIKRTTAEGQNAMAAALAAVAEGQKSLAHILSTWQAPAPVAAMDESDSKPGKTDGKTGGKLK